MNQPNLFRRSSLAWLAGLVVFSGVATATRASNEPGQIAISPSRFEVTIGSRPTTESVTVLNLGKKDVTIAVSTATWDLDPENRIRILEPDEQSLDQWMVINPLRFTVAAGKSQTVRFSIRPRVQPEDGEHRAMIYFNQVLPELSEQPVRVKFSIGVAVYGFAGDVTRFGKLHNVELVEGANPMLARLDVSSDGSAHVRLQGQYAIYAADQYPGADKTTLLADFNGDRSKLPDSVITAGTLPARPILPSTRRELFLKTPRELPPGRYVLDLNGTLAGESIDLAIPFTVSEKTLVAESTPE